MKRRDALGRVALLMGGTLSAPTMLAFLEGCKPSTESSSAMTFPFSADRKALVSEVAEIIIPKTDTPGAKDAKVGEFIEMMLKDCYAGKDQESFNKGLAELEKKDFLKVKPEEQTKILKEMEANAKDELDKAGEEKKKYTEAGIDAVGLLYIRTGSYPGAGIRGRSRSLRRLHRPETRSEKLGNVIPKTFK
jgi:hypothetical protein